MRADWTKLKKVSFLLLLVMAGCYTTVEVLRSNEEIESFNEEIEPLPDSLLTIPSYNGHEAEPIIQLSKVGTWKSIEYILYSNGELYVNGEFVNKIEQGDLDDIIQGLNKRGLFKVSHENIQDKIWHQRRTCFFELFFLNQGRPVVLDGGSDILQVTFNKFKYCISYDAVWFDAKLFPTCQDIQILNNSINFLYREFKFYRE